MAANQTKGHREGRKKNKRVKYSSDLHRGSPEVSDVTYLLEDIEVLSTIGKGGYGVCEKVLNRKTGKILVRKRVLITPTSPNEKKKMLAEADVLKQLQHDHIATYRSHTIDHVNGIIHLYMDYYEKGDLCGVIHNLREARVSLREVYIRNIFWQVLSALDYCHHTGIHGKKVLHRDIKPGNIFLDKEGNVKVGDFGLARVFQTEQSIAKTQTGTRWYMSPEVLDGFEYNESCDIWSLGVTMFELCSLVRPFGSILHIVNADIVVKRIPDIYTDNLNGLIQNALTRQPDRRPSAETLLRMLRPDDYKGSHQVLEPHRLLDLDTVIKMSTMEIKRSPYSILLEFHKNLDEELEKRRKQEDRIRTNGCCSDIFKSCYAFFCCQRSDYEELE